MGNVITFNLPVSLMENFVGNSVLCVRDSDWSPCPMRDNSEFLESVPNSMILVDHYTKLNHKNELGVEYCYLNGSNGPVMLKWNFQKEVWEQFHFPDEQHV